MASLGCFHTSDMRNSKILLIKKSVFLTLPSWDLKTSPDENSIASNFLLSWWLPQWVGSLADGNIDPGSCLKNLVQPHFMTLFRTTAYRSKSDFTKGETHWIVLKQFWKLEWKSLGATEGCKLVCRASVLKKSGLLEDTSTLQRCSCKTDIFLIKECWWETVSGAGVPDPNQTEREFSETSPFLRERFGTCNGYWVNMSALLTTQETLLWDCVLSCGTSNENRAV